MAHANRSDEAEVIAGINITPLVDVVLVLLVVLMVTAGYIVARSIPVDLPKASTGEPVPITLAISLDRQGAMYLDGVPIGEAELRARVRKARAIDAGTRAILAADGGLAHRVVVRAIDLLRQEDVTRFAINVQPDDVGDKPR